MVSTTTAVEGNPQGAVEVPPVEAKSQAYSLAKMYQAKGIRIP